jgi:hypothetical protein
MANPYHDDQGRFCSRDGMLSSIDNLAKAGKVSEYILLKEEFDEIDKGNIVVSEETLNTILEKSSLRYDPETNIITGLEESEDNEDFDNINDKLDSQLTAIEEISNKGPYVYGDPEILDKSLQVLKESNYSSEVLQVITEMETITVDKKVELVLQHDPSQLSSLVREHSEHIFSNYKTELEEAITNSSKSYDLEKERNYEAETLAYHYVKNASTKEELQFIIDNGPETNFSGSYYDSAKAILEHSKCDKDMALNVLERSMNNPGSVSSFGTKVLRDKLRTQGIADLPELGYGLKGNKTIIHWGERKVVIPESLKGAPSDDVLEAHEDTLRRINKIRDAGLRSNAYARALSHINAYESNFKNIREDYKNLNTPNDRSVGLGTYGKYANALNRIHEVTDYNLLKEQLRNIEF